MSKNVMKRALALVLALSMVFSTVVVSSAAKKMTVKVAGKVAVTKTLTVAKGKKVSLTASDKKAKIKSSKKSVVKASIKKGKITLKAKKNGKATITVTAKKKKVTFKVNVVAKKKAPKAVTAKKSATVNVGSKATISCKVKAAAVSAKKSVATVKASGKKVVVTGKKAGTAKVYVSQKNNAANYKVVKVTVIAAPVTTEAPTTEAPKKVDPKSIVKDATKGEISATLPVNDIKKLTKVTAKVGKTDVAISDKELSEITAAVADKKVVELITNKVKGQTGKEITLAGKKVTVVSEYDATNGATVKYAGKNYSIKADNAKSQVVVNGKTATYDATTKKVTFSGLNADQLKKAEDAINSAQFTETK